MINISRNEMLLDLMFQFFRIDWFLVGAWWLIFLLILLSPLYSIYTTQTWNGLGKKWKRRPWANGESPIHRSIMTEPESIQLQIECYSLDWTDTKSNRFSAFPMEFTTDKLLPALADTATRKSRFRSYKITSIRRIQSLLIDSGSAS